MKILISLIFLLGLASGQTLTFTSTDSRCSGSPLTCTLDSLSDPSGAFPFDYGVQVNWTATGGGSWSVGADTGSSCASSIFGLFQGPANWNPSVGTPAALGATISGSSGSFMVGIISNAGVYYTSGITGCTPDTTFSAHTFTFSNGGAMAVLNVVPKTDFRPPAPIFLNGFGVTDVGLRSGPYNATQQNLVDALGGTGLVAYAVPVVGVVSSFTVLNGGSGYTNGASITGVEGCTGVTGTLNASLGVVTSITLGSGGACAGIYFQNTTFIWDQNLLPCSNCRPGGNFNIPAIGTPWTDELGNAPYAVTPVGFVANPDTQRSIFSAGDVYVVAGALGSTISGVLGGDNYIFPIAGAASPLWWVSGGDVGTGGVGPWWDTSVSTRMYGVVFGTPGSGTDTPFTQVDLTGGGGSGCITSKCYTQLAGPGTSGSCGGYARNYIFCAPYATYGEFFGTDFSHQGCNKAGLCIGITRYEPSFQATISGTTLTRTGGTSFDNRLLDQIFACTGGTVSSIVITAVANASTATLVAAPGNQASPITCTGFIPWQVFVWAPVAMAAQGASYTPITGDLTAMSFRPHPNYTGGNSVMISSEPDAVTGLYNVTISGNPSMYVGSFMPGSTTISNFGPGPVLTLAANNSYLSGPVGISSASSIVSNNSGSTSSYVGIGIHGVTYETTDKRQWFHQGTQAPYSYSTSMLAAANGTSFQPYNARGQGNFSSTSGAVITDEVGNAQLAPWYRVSSDGGSGVAWWTLSTSNGCAGSGGIGTSNVVHLSGVVSDTGFNTSTNNKILVGGVNDNSNCNGSQTITAVASSSGTLHDILTLATNANSTYTSANNPLAAATADVANLTLTQTDQDQLFLIREHGEEIRRFGHTRAVAYGGYTDTPRATLSQCATYIGYTGDNGIPQNYQVIVIPTGINGCLTNSLTKFDGTHQVNSAVGNGTTVTIQYSFPNSNSVCVEVGATGRFIDYPNATSGNCNGSVSPDSTYAYATDSSGLTNRTTSVTSSLTSGKFRITDGKTVLATGSFPISIPVSGSTVLGGSLLPSGILSH